MDEFEAYEKIVKEWKAVNKMQDLNQRLYDELGGALMYILEYAEKNNIVLPNKERLWRMVDNVHNMTGIVNNHRDKINNSPPKNKHPFSTPDDETEPKNLIPIQ